MFDCFTEGFISKVLHSVTVRVEEGVATQYSGDTAGSRAMYAKPANADPSVLPGR